ncbi:MAG TPA: beta-ketoacyl synthase N-terminal-like domain-containing protein [Syntrophales bacterium]|nr:beta-ketoacyl synthase N-terminal-like domain-containing protein [Syntrophales bacterium]
MTGSEAHMEGVAIIGFSGRFPGAPNTDRFWLNLRQGITSIQLFSDDELEAMGIPPEVYQHPGYVKAGTVIENVEMFDAEFFGFSPREAQITDPQHRMFLECAWEALERAGYDPERYSGLISVFAGCGPNRYLDGAIQSMDPSRIAEVFQVEIGNEKDYIATRVAYKLNLRGPSLTVQTACSTSLVAVHLACQNLLTYQCDLALAGGVALNPRHRGGYFYEEGMIPSPDGYCRAFDAKANGTVVGQGAGIVVLKRMSEALADRDRIYAVIRGSAVNNDGALKVGFTAPSVTGQADVIAMAQAISGVKAEDVRYVETHGTGTSLGDPIEIAALTQAFRKTTDKKTFCAIGSVKSNVGHLDAAAGVTGLIKTVLLLEHREIVPSLHYEEPNPNIDFDNSPFYVNTRLQPWERNRSPRIAGVSSFGIGGTNAHVIVEEAPEPQPSGPSREWHLFPLSARTKTALDASARNLAAHLKRHPELHPADVAYTLQTGRRTFSHRRIVVCRETRDAIAGLDGDRPGAAFESVSDPPHRDVIFMFSGQASEYLNMGLELYRREPVFRESIDRCSEILKPRLSVNLSDVLYPESGQEDRAQKAFARQSLTQSAIFAVEYALARLWSEWGIRPSALAGHSIGEYTAACLSGVFSLEDALGLVAVRGRLMEELPEGSMIAVFLSEKDLQPFLNPRLSIALINAPSLCVVAGETDDVENLAENLTGKGIDIRKLRTEHAFHSAMTESILDRFAGELGRVSFGKPRIPFVSNVTGTWIGTEEVSSPDYWVRHLRGTIRFSDCAGELLKTKNGVFLEVGPGPTLSTLIQQHPLMTDDHVVLSSMRHAKEQKSDVAFLLTTLGRLWLAGVSIDWPRFYSGEERRRVPLPTYPFDRKRYWLGEVKPALGSSAGQEPGSEPERVTEAVTPEPTAKPVKAFDHREHAVRLLTGIWQDLLGYSEIGVRDNFFDLGGSSLTALVLFARVDKKFGKKLPISTLYEAPTIDQLAGLLCEDVRETHWSSLVAIQPSGTKPPLFLVHGAGGNVLIYRDLARRLGPDQPVYGLQSRGLDGRQAVLDSIEEMASHYLQEILTQWKEGPYLLGGYCLGGSVALEMAQQLHRRGKDVAFLALMETYNFSRIRNFNSFKKLYYYMQKIEFHGRNFLLLEYRDKIKFLNEKMKVARGRKEVWTGMFSQIFGKRSNDHKQATSLYDLWRANDQAAFSYVPSPYPGKIVQYRPLREYAVHSSTEMGWDKIAEGGLEIHQLPVYPAGMLVEPFVGMLAEKIKTGIEESLSWNAGGEGKYHRHAFASGSAPEAV